MESRNIEIFQMYKNGKTMQEIADDFSFSRARAQQVVYKVIENNILKETGINPANLSEEEKKQLSVTIKEEILKIAEQRKQGINNKKILEIKNKMKNVPDYLNFQGLSSYAKALGEPAAVIRSLFPEVVDDILRKTKNQWSQHYNKCKICQTINYPHRSYGFCEKCYTKSDYFKEINESSRLRNKHKWIDRQKVYIKKYNQKPEIILRKKKQWDDKMFGGNRLKALERDGYKCAVCYITRAESIKKINRDLYVTHIGDKNNNNLDNLQTVCQKCHNHKMVKIMRSKLDTINNDI